MYLYLKPNIVLQYHPPVPNLYLFSVVTTALQPVVIDDETKIWAFFNPRNLMDLREAQYLLHKTGLKPFSIFGHPLTQACHIVVPMAKDLGFLFPSIHAKQVPQLVGDTGSPNEKLTFRSKLNFKFYRSCT